MNKQLKETLKSVFDAPTPIKKDEFLQTLSFPKSTYKDFICCQIGYIRKRVWLLSVLLLLGVAFSLFYLDSENTYKLVWCVASILPFIALLCVTELSRSMSYNMTELEMSCKYSFQDVILARISILIGANFVLFSVLFFMVAQKTDYSFWRVGVYLILPFLLTCVLTLYTVNYFKSRETTYICGAISCFVTIVNSLIATNCQIVYESEYLYIWSILLCVLIILVGTQACKFVKKTEALQWNLPLID